MRTCVRRVLATLLLFGSAACLIAAAVPSQTVPAPSPSAPPAPSGNSGTAALRLSQVQFADAEHGWTSGALGDSPSALVWRTTNGGRAWHAAALGNGVQDAAFGMADRQHGWAVGPSDCQFVSGTSVCGKLAILNTRDGGATWQSQWAKDDPKAGSDNEVEAVNAATAYVRAGPSVWKTTDGGSNWLEASIPSSEASPYQISFVDESVGFAAGRMGTECPEKGLVPSSPNADCKTAVWKTTDGGKSWKKLAHAPRHGGAWYPADIQFVDKRNGYLLLVNPNTHGSLLYSTANGGIGWKLRNTKIPGARPYPVKLEFVTPRTGYVPLRVGAGPVDGGLLRTVNGGAAFTQVKDPRLVSVEDADFITARRGFVISLNPDNPTSTLLLGTTNGGGSWTDLTPRTT
ncbi:WD40/YVTN/BNR-like repeat-containing protein [Cohnella lubricantis]|uniref:Photosynthesis system II assembly factor Ycf48/Hcf136-like domain-containing protein n=1 Tax=Cohnella lubricantis TaxID=2163172 RepID=A0A841T845_9BACL|nr:hypothetical protein [Cohnella lubricantis]MBB6677102.1 hypothetical protein [Cohnella lubricantis]MBP2118949.1 photosystem II stability/assembly factor-like uncharacterized protein [Cohnella lubricantis]